MRSRGRSQPILQRNADNLVVPEHQHKVGTPTMGGLAILAAAAIGYLVSHVRAGVVFSDQALDFLQQDDPATHALITPRMLRWRDMTLSLKGEQVVLDGIGFAAIGRLEPLCVRAFVCVLCPRTGSPRRCLSPR